MKDFWASFGWADSANLAGKGNDMSFDELLSRIEALPPSVPGEVRPPPPEIIGFFVYVTRKLRKWKRYALADMAGISVSTVERVERGEAVEAASLEKLEKAFGLELGYISSSRAALTEEEMILSAESQAKLTYIDVRPLKTQPQVRELAECCGFLPLSNVPDIECKEEIQALNEWFDLASFIRSEVIARPSSEGRRLRELYKAILDCVKGLERQGYNVLAGTLKAPVEGMPDWSYAVLWVTSKRSDPGGSKRQFIPFDTSVLPKKLTMADCTRWFDDD